MGCAFLKCAVRVTRVCVVQLFMSSCFAVGAITIAFEALTYIGTATVADWIVDDWTLGAQVLPSPCTASARARSDVVFTCRTGEQLS